MWERVPQVDFAFLAFMKLDNEDNMGTCIDKVD